MDPIGIFIICIGTYAISVIFVSLNIHTMYCEPIGRKFGIPEHVHQSNCLIWTPILNTIIAISFMFKSSLSREYKDDIWAYKVVIKMYKDYKSQPTRKGQEYGEDGRFKCICSWIYFKNAKRANSKYFKKKDLILRFLIKYGEFTPSDYNWFWFPMYQMQPRIDLMSKAIMHFENKYK